MKKMGLALAGGGARGAYQIGAWKALKEEGYDALFDAYAGASVGSLNAMLFAMGDYQKAEDIWMSLDRDTLFNFEDNVFKRILREKLKFLNKGMFETDRLETMIEETMDFSLLKDKEVYIAATKVGSEQGGFFDLISTNYEHYIKSNSQIDYKNIQMMKESVVKDALLASCAIPVVFHPVTFEGQTYYDGGLLNNIPYQPLIDAGCEKILAIDLFKFSFSRKKSEEIEIKTLHPKKSLRGVLDFKQKHVHRRFELGYQEMKKFIEDNRTFFEENKHV
jgi:NTE family protein